MLLVPIDKATGNIALVSKRFYATVITDFIPLLLENWDWVITHLHKKAMKIQAMKLILSMCSTLSDPTKWFNHFVLVSIGKSCFSYDHNYVINRDNDDHKDGNLIMMATIVMTIIMKMVLTLSWQW